MSILQKRSRIFGAVDMGGLIWGRIHCWFRPGGGGGKNNSEFNAEEEGGINHFNLVQLAGCSQQSLDYILTQGSDEVLHCA